MLGKLVSSNQFFQNFVGEGPHTSARGLRAFGARGRPALPAAAPRTSTQSCRENMPPPKKIGFTSYAYVSECSLSGRGHGHVSNFYTVDVENFATASRRYTGDIHNSVCSRFVYDTYRTMEATRSRHG